MTIVTWNLGVGGGIDPGEAGFAKSHMLVRATGIFSNDTTTILPFPGKYPINSDGTGQADVKPLPEGFAYGWRAVLNDGMYVTPERFTLVPASGTVQWSDLEDVTPVDAPEFAAPAWAEAIAAARDAVLAAAPAVHEDAVAVAEHRAAVEAVVATTDGTMTAVLGDSEAEFTKNLTSAIGTVAPTAAADAMGNPESALNSATVEVVESVLGGGTANLLKLNTGSIDSLAAPRLPGGPNLWLVSVDDYDADEYPTNFQSGDVRARTTETTAPFDPLDVAGLELFFEMARVTHTDGTAVASVADESPSGIVLTQATGTKQPLYDADAANGRPALQFDGVDDVLRSGALTAIDSHGLTVYYVIGGGPATNATSSKFALDRLTPTGTTQGGAIYRSTANKWVVSRGTAATIASPDSSNAPHVFKIKYAASGLLADVYLDGALVVDDGAIGNTASQTFVEWVFGSRADSPNGANFWPGWIAAVASVRNIVGDDETALDAYFHDRYLVP